MFWHTLGDGHCTAAKKHEHRDEERRRSKNPHCDFGAGHLGPVLGELKGSPTRACVTIADWDMNAKAKEVPSHSMSSASSGQSRAPHPPRTRLFNLWQATAGAHATNKNTGLVSQSSAFSIQQYCSSRRGTTLSGTPHAASKGLGDTLLAASLDSSPSILPQVMQDMHEEDGMVRVLPPRDQLLLIDGASRYHRMKPTQMEKRDLEYTDKFKDICKRKYTTLIHAWRWLLDYEGVGRIAFSTFCKTAKSIGFREPKRLWAVLNTRKTSFLTLDEWDPVAFRNLFEFRGICYEQFGTMETAFKFGMDRTGSSTITMQELTRFCDDYDFSGDVQVLFEALDMHKHRYITLDELDFLRKWEGEKHGHLERHFDFQYSRLNQRKRAKNVQKQKVCRLPRRNSLLSEYTNWFGDLDLDGLDDEVSHDEHEENGIELSETCIELSES